MLRTGTAKPKGGARLLRYGVPLAVLAGVGAYYRYRPNPAGINGWSASYRVPAERIRFFHDTTWYEHDRRQSERQITEEVVRIVRAARRFAVMDVFLFSLHHADRAPDYIPTTRLIADAFAASRARAWFITDPINTSYGSWVSPPLRWLEEAGVEVCVTDLRKLRDNNMLYSPLWRTLLRWVGPTMPPRFANPLEPNATITPWALLEAINARGNHRKVLVADDGEGGYVSLVTSANFEDASCYFGNTALTVRDAAVARHYLEAEKAVARMSGLEIPVDIPAGGDRGDAEVTPLMGAQIKRALVRDIDDATPRDRLFVFAQFLSERGVIEALVRASRRGVPGVLVLDQNKVNFGNPKTGYPNQITGPELAHRTDFELRWADVRREEYHNQFMLLERPDRVVMHVGSANYNRRSLSDTVLESNVRVDAPKDSAVARQVLEYAHWMAEAPRSAPYDQGRRRESLPEYAAYRFLEASGSGTF